MAYIGRNPAIGTQKVLDSLESQFNGNLTTFDLRYNSNTIYPPIASALIVSLGGVLQEPGVAYTVASDTITFASAPPTGADCWILLYTEFGGAAGATANLTVSNNLTIGNELHGPANFVIDPSTIGDNTGTVEIKGNLTVQGTQTTVNSTTVDLDHLSLGDNEIANFGDDNDLQIYHNSTGGGVSYIKDVGPGALRVVTNTLRIRPSNDIGHMATFIESGAVELYHNNNLKFETTSTGVTVTGTVAADGISLGDNNIANFGDDNDLQIRHNNSNSIIEHNGTGNLYIQTTGDNEDLYIQSADNVLIRSQGSEDGIRVIGNGAVELYYNNAKKLETTSTGVTVTGTVVADGLSLGDSEVANFGSNNNLQISHNTNGLIANSAGNLILASNGLKLKNGNSSKSYYEHSFNGEVKLFHDNNLKFETTSTGVTITGALEVSAATNLTVGGTSLPSLTGLLGGSLSGTLGAVTMAYLPSAPNSPVQGQFYFNSLNQKAQIYTGSAFVDLVPSGGGGGGGGGGGSSTDANATFRKYTYSISSTTNSITGSSDTVVSAGSFIVGYKYTIKTVGTTDFTAIGASANTVGVVFTATGAGSGSGDAFDTLFYSTGGDQNVEVYVNGVKAVEGSTNDYVATSGTSVNLVANVTSGDVVEIQVYELLTNDAFVLATGGTFTGNVGINTSTINNRLHIHSNANEQGILLTQGGDNYSSIAADSDRLAEDRYILDILAKWNGTKAAQITLETGNDTTNKDDGRIKFWTASSGGSLNVAMHIAPSGNIGIGLSSEDEATEKLDVNGNIQIAEKVIHRGDTNTHISFPSNDYIRLTTSGSSRLNATPNGYILLGTNSEPSGGDPHSRNAKLLIQGRIGNTADSGRLNLQRGSSTSNGSSIGSISFTDNSNNAYARIETIADAATGSADFPGAIIFSTTNDGASTPTEKLRISSNGNIEFNGKLFNDSLNQTPAAGAGAINLKPSASGGSTGIIFDSNVNNASDFGYIWWYDDNDNYNTRTDSNGENSVLVIGTANDDVSHTAADSIAIESSGNIFLNPGVDGFGGSDTPDFTQGKVYVGNSTTKYEVWHEGNDSSLLVNNQGFIKTLGNVTFNDSVFLQFGTGGLDTRIAYDGPNDILNVALKSGSKIVFYDLSDTDNSISLYLQTATNPIADTFSPMALTEKKYIYFSNPNGSNDPGFIMHETSDTETNEGVLHLCPSDDNDPSDYVSIHGTNDPDALKLHADGSISTGSTRQLVLSSGSGDVKVDDNLEVTGTLKFAAHPTDTASISTEVSGSNTYLNFNLSDDNNQERFRWRFDPAGSTAVYNAMVLRPESDGKSVLELSGDLIYNNNAIIASNASDNNIDHIWHSDAAFAGTPGSWNFCSDTTYKNTGNSGVRMGGKLGVGATPGGNPGNLAAFIALGDSDTGIAQDGDGELELWANNQEILHLNTSEVNLLKNFRCGGGTGLPGYNNTTNGVYIERNNGSIFAYRSTGFGLHLGRSNNGEVIRIKKNNSTQAGTLNITSNSTVALQNGSDYRLKTNIEQIPNVVSSFRQLKPCQFEYISEPGEVFQGFIAHELQEVNPKFASGVKDEVDENGDIVEQGVDTRNLVPLLTAALQEAFNMIDNLQEQINQLSNP